MREYDIQIYRERIKTKICEVVGGNEIIGLKAAVLTWCNTNGPTNYGQILQCYAMQTILSDFGLDVRVIHYQKAPQVSIEKDLERVVHFQKFINRYIHLTKICYGKKMVEEATSDCDLLICGSDQIWNPTLFDPIFILDFGGDKQKRMAIAASGLFYKDESNEMVIRHEAGLIRHLDYVSVREQSGVDILSDFGIESELIPDPTLLLRRDECEALLQESESEKEHGYILSYFLGEYESFSQGIKNVMHKYCVDNVKKILRIPSNIIEQRIIRGINIQDKKGIGPLEFLDLIRNAKAVITDSYHGAIFANKFGVPLYCGIRKQNGAKQLGAKERLETLEKHFNIKMNKLLPNTLRNHSDVLDIDNQLGIHEIYKEVQVSIVIPIHNAEKYLDEFIGSIITQTWNKLEIICMDYGSADKSLEILERYAADDPRIQIFHQENKYTGAARNNGFTYVTGKYVMFPDIGRIFEPETVEKMVLRAESTKADIVLYLSEGFGENEDSYDITGSVLNLSYVSDKDVFSASDIPEYIYGLFTGMEWNELYCSDFIREKKLRFLDTMSYGDFYFTSLACVLASKISAVKDILIRDRRFSNISLWHRHNYKWRDTVRILKSLRDELKRLNMFQCFERAFINLAVQMLYDYIIWESEYQYLREFHGYCSENLDNDFEMFSYFEDYFYEPFKYNALRISSMYDSNEWIAKILNIDIIRRENFIQKLEFHFRETKRAVKNLKEYSEMLARRKYWLIPYDAFPVNSRLILYGLGDVGRDYCRQIQREAKWELIAAIDRNVDPGIVDGGIRIVSIEALKEMREEFDYIVITIADKGAAADIKTLIQEQGVESRKICWLNPCGHKAGISEAK